MLPTQSLLELRHHHISPYLLAKFRCAGRDYPQRLLLRQRGYRDPGHALIVADPIAFRHGGFAWTVKTLLAMILISGYISGNVCKESAKDAECPKKVPFCLSPPSETARYDSSRGTGAQG
jgi:hypothetical protein